jgi:DNA processing protein
MTREELAALVALLQCNRRPGPVYAELIESGQSPAALLERDLSESDDGQRNLLAGPGPEALIERAAANIDAWEEEGMILRSVLDDAYPDNLRGVYDRPPLIFVAGALRPGDTRSLALIGSRRASDEGLARARQIALELADHGYTIVSGLAAGIDTAAHTATLAAGGRTIAVIGSGLQHAYPPENAELQRRIAARGAVVSQFWPEAPASRHTFPLRNATMSGLALATVIVEASPRSGARIQARLALAHGRPVFMAAEVLGQPWAAELATRPGVSAFTAPQEILTALDRLADAGALTA